MLNEILRYILLSTCPKLFINRSAKKKAEGVIITLTTLPSRIANIAPTLSSLIHQTVGPEKIILNLPNFSKREQTGYDIPEFLKTNPLIEINRIETDLGPATKLLPTLKRYSSQKEKLIIIADDDEIYPKKLIENYLIQEKVTPNAVLTLVGWEVPKDLNHAKRIVKYGAIGSKPANSVQVNKPTRVDCVQGASTFAVKPCFFDDDIFDYSKAPKEAFFVDDIYVSGHFAQLKVPVYVIPAPFRFARMKVLTHLVWSEALHRKENKTGHNNNTLYEFYKSFWSSLTEPKKN